MKQIFVHARSNRLKFPMITCKLEHNLSIKEFAIKCVENGGELSTLKKLMDLESSSTTQEVAPSRDYGAAEIIDNRNQRTTLRMVV